MVTAALLKRAGVLIHLSIARAATLGLDGAGNVRKMSSGHKIAAQGTSLHLEPSGQPADSTVIFMHGLGDTAHVSAHERAARRARHPQLAVDDSPMSSQVETHTVRYCYAVPRRAGWTASTNFSPLS